MTTVWQCSNVEIVKHFGEVYSLMFKGEEVKTGTFDFVTRYFWREFADIA